MNERLERAYAADIETRVRNYLTANWSNFQAAFPEFAHLKKPSAAEFANNIFLAPIVAQIGYIASLQIEETFCDALGVSLFGASYVYAFHYLLAPNLGGPRSTDYPPLRVRAAYLTDYSDLDLQALGFANYADEFREVPNSFGGRVDFLLLVADAVRHELAPDAYKHGETIATDKVGANLPNPGTQDAIVQCFKRGRPFGDAASVADVLNAGWQYVVSERPTFDENKRPLFDWISELVLKSLEVQEFAERTK